MNNENAIQQELKELNSVLAGVPRVLPYSVPEGYFSLFERHISMAIKDGDMSEEPTIGTDKSMPFTVPPGYFEGLTGNIIGKTSGMTLSKEMPYELPEDYFNALPFKVLQAAKEQDSKKGRSIPASKFVFKHLRLAAAAVLLLCVGLGAYTTLFNATSYKSPDVILRTIPQSEIEAYLETTDRNEGEDISAKNLAFDSKDIVVYLNETGWE